MNTCRRRTTPKLDSAGPKSQKRRLVTGTHPTHRLNPRPVRAQKATVDAFRKAITLWLWSWLYTRPALVQSHQSTYDGSFGPVLPLLGALRRRGRASNLQTMEGLTRPPRTTQCATSSSRAHARTRAEGVDDVLFCTPTPPRPSPSTASPPPTRPPTVSAAWCAPTKTRMSCLAHAATLSRRRMAAALARAPPSG